MTGPDMLASETIMDAQSPTIQAWQHQLIERRYTDTCQ